MNRFDNADVDLVDLGSASVVTQGSLKGLEDIVGGNEPTGLSND